MRKHLLSFRATLFAVLALIGFISCTSDSTLDSGGRIDAPDDPLTVESSGGDLTLDVKSNAYWTVSFIDEEDETVSWVTADVVSGMGDQKLTLTVSTNAAVKERKAYVVISTDDGLSETKILLTQAGGGSGDGAAIKPISEFFLADPTKLEDFTGSLIGLTFDQATNKVTFNSGNTVQRVGTVASTCEATMFNNARINGRFVVNGWGGTTWQDAAVIVKFKAASELKGKLRFGFGLMAPKGNTPKTWDVQWSADGTTWNKGAEIAKTPYGESSFGPTIELEASSPFKMARFTIPNAQTIREGSYIYLRIAPTSNESRGAGEVESTAVVNFAHGFYLASDAMGAYNTTELPTGDDVVLTEGFDELTHGHDYFLPGRHFLSNVHLPYAGFNGWTTTGTVTECPGYPMFGAASSKAGALTTPELTALGDTPTNIRVSFKLAFFLPANYNTEPRPITVEATGAGKVDGALDFSVVPASASAETVEEMEAMDAAHFRWYDYSIDVVGATKATKITFATNGRHFIDDVVIVATGKSEPPVEGEPVKAAVSEIRAQKGAGTVTITENNYMLGRVVSVANLPANTFALTDGQAGILVTCPNHGVAVGEELKVVVKGATIATDANGLLAVTLAKAADITKTESSVEAPQPKAITAAELKAGTYEGMYVSLPASQVVAADLSKPMGGSITMELADQTTYTMKTLAGAAFAAQTVPQKSGVVKGLAGSDCLMPTAMTDLDAMTSARFGATVYAVTPISEFFLADPAKLDDLTGSLIGLAFDQETNKVTFDSGNTMQRVGTVASTCVATMNDTKRINGRFVVNGWGGTTWQDAAVIVKLKATSELKGKLRFGFGLMAPKGNTPKTWAVQWSADGTTWNQGVEIAKTPYAESSFGPTIELEASSPFKIARFEIPAAKAIATGSYIYLRIAPTSNESRGTGEVDPTVVVNFAHGVYLTTDEPRAYNTTDLPSGANVVFAEGFDDAMHGHDYFLPGRHFLSNIHQTYAGAGWTVADRVTECPGYLMLGASSTPKNGTLTTPALTALGDTPTDVTVSFKLAFFVPANYNVEARTLTVSAEGAGAVQGALDFSNVPAIVGSTIAEMQATDAAYFKWYDYSVKVTGATKATKLVFATTTGRNFIDDIVVTKD